eukprot:765720-Hanusia_phi.AAC.2
MEGEICHKRSALKIMLLSFPHDELLSTRYDKVDDDVGDNGDDGDDDDDDDGDGNVEITTNVVNTASSH